MKTLTKSFITAGILSAVLLGGTACAAESAVEPEPTDTVTSPEPEETEPGTGDVVMGEDTMYETTVVTDSWDFTNAEFPSLAEVVSDSFVLIHGGSSSCPDVIKDVDVDETEVVIEIEKDADVDTACTSDFQFVATQITLTNAPDIANHEFFIIRDGGEKVPVYAQGATGEESTPTPEATDDTETEMETETETGE